MQTNDLPEVEYSSTCLYTGPTKASIPIHNGAELKLLSNRTCRIIQIGPIESANDGVTSQWINVQIGRKNGWILGGISPQL